MNMNVKVNIKCGFVVCTRAGSLDGSTFLSGDVYPIIGNNNGLQIGYCDSEGNGKIMLLHNYGDILFSPEADRFSPEFMRVGADRI